MTQTTTINIDLSRPNIPAVVYAKQHDIDTRKIEVSLLSNGAAYIIPAGVSGQVNIAKPDDTGCYYDVDSISGNKVTFTLVEQALAAAGTAKVDVSLLSIEDDEVIERLTSFSFDLVIEARAIEDSALVSSDYYNALMVLSESVLRSVTFTPSVNSDGVISWTNNGGITNPESVNIKGPQGIQGIQGIQGPQGSSISSVYEKSVTAAPGGTSTYGVKVGNTEVGTFNVTNGNNVNSWFEYFSLTSNRQKIPANYSINTFKAVKDVSASSNPTFTIKLLGGTNAWCLIYLILGANITTLVTGDDPSEMSLNTNSGYDGTSYSTSVSGKYGVQISAAGTYFISAYNGLFTVYKIA